MDNSTESPDVKDKANSVTNQMGRVSIVLFFAFLLSGMASVAGAIFATRKFALKAN